MPSLDLTNEQICLTFPRVVQIESNILYDGLGNLILDLSSIGGGGIETDPIFSASAAFGISSLDISNWNAKQNAITTGTNLQYFRGDFTLATFPTNISAFTNDSHYLTSFTETDPVWTAASSNYRTKVQNDLLYKSISYVPTWSDITSTPTTLAGYGITDAYTKTASDARYLQSETDPIFTASAAFTISSSDITNWNSKEPTISGTGFVKATGTTITYDNSTYLTTSSAAATYQPIGTYVNSVSGTSNRVTSSGGTTPAIDISASYVGQSSITTLGTITTGVWNGTAIIDAYISSAATWNAKQNAITTGTTLQYLRGDLSLATFPTNVSSFTNDANYLTANQTITLTGDVSGSGTTAITTTIGASKVTNAMLAGGIDLTSKVTGLLPDGNIASAATWNAKQNALSGTGFVKISGTTISYDNSTYLTTSLAASTYVTSVTGTLNRIISSGGLTPAIDISASYVGQSSITTLGTIGVGIWNGTAITDTYISSSATWNSKQNAITTGTTAQYFRGDLTLATFPTNVSTFTNDANYAVNSIVGFVSTTGALTGSDTILQAIEKLDGNIGTAVNDGLRSGGVVSWSGTGLIFNVTAAVYYIQGIRYTTTSGTATLTTADNTFDRIDVIVLDTSSNIVVITGVAAANPQTPQANPITQLYLTSILVQAGATTPTGVTTTTVYDENTEFTGSTSGLTVNFADTTAPYHGTKHVSTTAWSNNNTLIFTKPAGTIDLSAIASLTFAIRLLGVLSGNQSISVQFFNGTTSISNTVAIGAAQGFVKTTTGSYQPIALPLNSFTFSSYTANKVQFSFTGNNSTGFYLDYIILQSGVASVVTSYVSNVSRSGDNINQTINNVQQLAFTISDKAPNILTGYVSGNGIVSGTDTVLQAIQKLNGNLQPVATGNYLFNYYNFK